MAESMKSVAKGIVTDPHTVTSDEIAEGKYASVPFTEGFPDDAIPDNSNIKQDQL